MSCNLTIGIWVCIYLLIPMTNNISAHSLFDYLAITSKKINTTDDSHPLSHCQGGLAWQPCSKGDYPPGAVKAGVDINNGSIYVGRAHYDRDLLPAKVVPSRGFAYVSYADKEVILNEYEVLVTDCFAWTPCSGGNVSRQAIEVGYTADEERLYYGRTSYEGSLQTGKVQPSQGCLYVPFGGKELKFKDYEVLIQI